MKNFRIPPISTLIGSTFPNYLKVIRQGRVERRYILKLVLTTFVVLISIPFHFWEYLKFRKKLKNLRFEKPPLFIIGHWRSGTTFLHNILCQDPEAGYLTTYQSVFPHNLGSKMIFKNFMKWNMPEKRPSDNVRLNINYPQEDEFAMANSVDDAYYNFFYFPEKYEYYAETMLSAQSMEKWRKNFHSVAAKAMLNTGGTRAILKNPVNTFRVEEILKLYPEARFIFIYRNPVTIFLSARNFFTKLMPTLWFHSVSDDFIREMIFTIFPRMMDHYQKTRSLIPESNLLEIRFEEFEQDPEKFLKIIYSDLFQEDYGKVKSQFREYLNSQNSYVKNTYEVDRYLVEEIEKHWGRYMKERNYKIPEELTIL